MSNSLFKRFLSALLIFLLLFTHSFRLFAEEPKDSELHARSAVLMDAENGRVLYEKNSSDVLPMASTTKIMTCILALENGNLDDVVTASSYAASQPKVHLGMSEGREYHLSDLLYSLMLESHNDSAVAIAEHIAGSVEGFSDLMNQKARDLGCVDTFFVTPNGLDAQAVTADGETRIHSTTARDLARIMMYCIKESPKKEEFLTITRTTEHSFTDFSGNFSYSCYNHNAFLSMMEGALSGKTGFTGNAGYCYVGALTKDGKTFVVALLACGWPNNKTYKWADTKKLMNYGLSDYSYRDFTLPEGADKLSALPVQNGRGDDLGETATVSITVKETPFRMLMREDEQIETECELRKDLTAPVFAGTIVGQIRYLVNEKVVKTDVITAEHDVLSIDFFWCFKKVFSIFLSGIS